MKLKKISQLLLLCFVFFLPFASFAQDNKEETRSSLEEMLDIDIPYITDNPSLLINFTDPSKEKGGVELSLDEKEYNKIQSPFTLPALSIGSHSLTFRFLDQYDVSQTLTKILIITPRPPALNTPNINSEGIIFTGRALAGSEITLILNSNNKMVVKQTEVDQDGVWTLTIAEDIPQGLYTFSAFAKKYGYSSELAEPLTLDVSERKIDNGGIGKNTPIYFTFKDFTKDDLRNLTSDHIDLLVLSIGLFLIGLLVGFLLLSFSKKKEENRVVNEVEKKFVKPTSKDEKNLTLLEKLKDKTVNIENPPVVKDEVRTNELPKEKKIISKVDFLKSFKSHDPDDEKGKETEDEKEEKKSK